MSYDPNIPMFMQKPGAVAPKPAQKGYARPNSTAQPTNPNTLAIANKARDSSAGLGNRKNQDSSSSGSDSSDDENKVNSKQKNASNWSKNGSINPTVLQGQNSKTPEQEKRLWQEMKQAAYLDNGKKKKHHSKTTYNTGEEIPYKGQLKQKDKVDKQGRRINTGNAAGGIGIGLLESLKQKFQTSKQKIDEKFHDPEAYPDPYNNVQNTDNDRTRQTDMPSELAEDSSNITPHIPGSHDTIVDREDFEKLKESRESQNVYCNICKQNIDTKVTEEYSIMQYIFAILFCFCLPFVFFVPLYCCDKYKHYKHQCPRCKFTLYKYKYKCCRQMKSKYAEHRENQRRLYEIEREQTGEEKEQVEHVNALKDKVNKMKKQACLDRIKQKIGID